MNTKLQETFNLPKVTNLSVVDEDIEDIEEVSNALSIIDKVDAALPSVKGLQKHDREMDVIAKKALTSYDELVLLAGNMDDDRAARFFEVANSTLKTALDARNSKITKKLQIIDMQMKRLRLGEKADAKEKTQHNDKSAVFDRNELLRHFVQKKIED